MPGTSLMPARYDTSIPPSIRFSKILPNLDSIKGTRAPGVIFVSEGPGASISARRVSEIISRSTDMGL